MHTVGNPCAGVGVIGGTPPFPAVGVLPALQYGISVALPAKSHYLPLTVCSWEQNETMIKVYVPLRGVQTENLRSVFDATSILVQPPSKHVLMFVLPTLELPKFCAYRSIDVFDNGELRFVSGECNSSALGCVNLGRL